MRRILSASLAVLTIGLGSGHATGQSPPIDVKNLPAEIKSLSWKDIDLATVSPLERCRALMLMNDVLAELGAQLTADADLMSQYIDVNNLGEKFAAIPPLADPSQLTMENGLQIAVALLRGPMAQSSYATQHSGEQTSDLGAYEQLYRSNCQWKWPSMAADKMQVRSMTAFLQAQGKWAAYQAWAPGEVERQKELQKAEQAQRRAEQQAIQQQKAEERQQKLQEQQEQKKQQQQEQAILEMQQSLCAAQQQQSQPADQQQVIVNGTYPYWYYGGVTGIAAADWYRDGAYQGAARARTEGRMSGWHRGAGRRR
ncbi:MAG: hypothetical protein JSR77_00430 [Planctomycetes bacterium]|nr:hypothetical protein [Planctomycetota bacterium]